MESEQFARERDRQKKNDEAKRKRLDAALARGIADAEAGRVTPLDEAFQQLRWRLNLMDDGNEA